MLSFLLIIPLLSALAIGLAPERASKGLAMLGSLLALAAGAAVVASFDWGRGSAFQFAAALPVVPELGVTLSLGVDTVALWLVVLTVILQPLCVLGSFSAITERTRTYYASLMALQAAMLGVFLARDLIFFYVCFEFTLVPMYVLISLYGSTNRRKAATKFFLYTFTGSIIALAGLIYVAWVAATRVPDAAGWTFDIATLRSAAQAHLSPTEQGWVMLAMMAGFAVKVPLFPVHTWLPLAHTEAPTAGSVILAGVLLKLGTYAIYRFVLPFVPVAVVEYAHVVAALSIVGILYGGLICWVQRDVKKLVAYSSVAHLGFCMLGMFALNAAGVQGSILYMINHGLSTGALFFLIGFMYERYHTRSLEEVGGLGSKMPIWSTFMVFFMLASVGLPGLNGFVSEFLCVMGAFQSGAYTLGPGGTAGPLGPWYAFIAGFGMIVAAMYLLYMTGRIVFGPLREPPGHDDHGHGHAGSHEGGGLPADLTAREVVVLAPIAALCLFLGVYPKPLIATLEGPVNDKVQMVLSLGNAAGAAPAGAAGGER
ncbi:MAG: NADH-quinone oxidoreductase subunit M [Phycisphaerales bacterium]|nr:NADH-quinone oxidoreductase subunit M [Phycisphaerales bacterium]